MFAPAGCLMLQCYRVLPSCVWAVCCHESSPGLAKGLGECGSVVCWKHRTSAQVQQDQAWLWGEANPFLFAQFLSTKLFLFGLQVQVKAKMLRPCSFLQAFWGRGCRGFDLVTVPGSAGEQQRNCFSPGTGALGFGDPALEESGFSREGRQALL